MRNVFPLIGLSLMSLSIPLLAEESNSHSAHVHGAAKLQIVSEKNAIEMHFESPAMNIVGFEHDVNNQEQAERVKKSLATLASTTDLFKLSGGKCEFISSGIESPFEEGERHDEHKNHEKHGHHDEHKQHEEHGHDHHEKHDHDKSHDAHAESEHTDFEAEYKAACEDSSKLSRIDFPLLDQFKGIETLDVQYIIHGKQGSVSVSKPNTYIELSK